MANSGQWLKGFKADPLLRYPWKYYDVSARRSQ
jgi:hypothetical protein